MAPRIPRVSKGEVPSAVPRGPLGDPGTSALFKGLTDLADTGVDIAADAEQREAENLRMVLEAKTAITNDIAGARLAGDYEESLFTDTEQLKVKYAKNPEKIFEEFIPAARAKADNFRKEAGNGQIALDFARQSGARIQGETRRLHEWVSTQQSQNAKDDISKMLHGAAAKARKMPNLAALNAHILGSETTLLPRAILAYGEKEGRTAIRKMRADMVDEFYYGPAGLADPKGAAASLDQGVAAENASTDQRRAIRNHLKDVHEGRGIAQFENLAWDTVRRSTDIYKASLDESLDGTTILSMRRENEARREALEKDPTLDDKQRADQLGLLQKRVEFLDYSTKIYRKRIPAEIADSPEAVAAASEVMDEYTALFKNPDDSEDGDTAKSHLPRVLALQHKAAALAVDKKLGGTNYSTIMAATARMVGEGAQAASEDTWSWGLRLGWPPISVTQTSEQRGNEKLRDLFEADYRDVPQNVRNAAWFHYTRRFGAEAQLGDVNPQRAEGIAQESIDWAIARNRRPK